MYFIQLFFVRAEEYLYPVTTVKKRNQTYLYLLYQHSQSHLELLLWNPDTKEISKELPSIYNPAGVKVLMSDQGFSFIDNGRLKIKFFNKRSPKALDFYEPIYNIEVLEWIDDQSFYFSAIEHGHYTLFQGDIQGTLHRLSDNENECDCIFQDDIKECHQRLSDSKNECDCMYPQKIDRHLFYIERTKSGEQYRLSDRYRIMYHYRIMCMPYPSIDRCPHYTFNSSDDFDSRVEALLQKKEGLSLKTNKKSSSYDQQCIFDNGDHPIAFLHMVNDHEGFFIKHSAISYLDDSTMLFDYNSLKKNAPDDTWRVNYLFTFEIPSSLLIQGTDKRLYESMLPLLPRHHENIIYYSSLDNQSRATLAIFSYDLTSGVITKRTKNYTGHCLAPLILGNKVFFGNSFISEKSLPIRVNSENTACYDLQYL